MRIIETPVYTFAELSETAKATAVDSLRDINVDYAEWADCVIESNIKRLEEMGFRDVKIDYSGFWSQGDGACFTSDWVYMDKLLTAFGATQAQRDLIGRCGCEIKFIRNCYHYNHENCVGIYASDYSETTADAEDLQQLIEAIEEWARDKMKAIYNELREHHEALTSDAEVITTIEANDHWEFDEDGNRV